MRNIVDAIVEVVRCSHTINGGFTESVNRVNSVGEALEEYVKDIFAGAVDIDDIEQKEQLRSEVFSYFGNVSNPPDSMLKGGVAIEVKKIQSVGSALALNSSYPKAKLFADSPMISAACRDCEEWSVRDMLYCVGVVKGDKITGLAMVYGEDYCAERETYERIRDKIKEGVEDISGVEFTETHELGRINRVDPLGITYLRVRGMWGIENPFKVFKDYYTMDSNADFNMMVIINMEQLGRLDNVDALYDLERELDNFKIKKIRIKKPNNPAQLRDAVLVTYKVF